MGTLHIVIGDTPQIVLSIRDDTVRSQPPVDLSDAQTAVALKVRKVGSTNAVSVACTKLTGAVDRDGSIDTSAPYDVAGAGGRCVADCDASVFTEAGKYEAEAEVTFGASGRVVTVYELVSILVRADF